MRLVSNLFANRVDLEVRGLLTHRQRQSREFAIPQDDDRLPAADGVRPAIAGS